MNRRFNIAVTVVISLAFLALGVFVFGQSYVRFAESCRDFGLSVAYYFCELIGIDYSFTPTVTEYSDVMQWEILLPSDLEGFTASVGSFFALLIDGENFASYWSAVGNAMLVVAKVIAVLLPTGTGIQTITAIRCRCGCSRQFQNTHINRSNVPYFPTANTFRSIKVFGCAGSSCGYST